MVFKNAIIEVFVLCLLAFSVKLTIKVYRLVEYKALSLLLSMLAIDLSLFLFAVNLILDTIALYQYQQDDVFLSSPIGYTINEQIQRVSIMFLFSAFLNDIYKWSMLNLATLNFNEKVTFSFLTLQKIL